MIRRVDIFAGRKEQQPMEERKEGLRDSFMKKA
jgi:hypothetical protein